MSFRREAELVEACLRRETGAWDEFVDAYGPYIWSICLSRGLVRDLAEDAHQSTFVATWESLGSLRNPYCLVSWLARIAYREIEEVRRKAKLRICNVLGPTQETPAYAPEPDPGERLERLEAAQIVRDAIAGLPERYRPLMAALFLRSRPANYDEIALELGIPRGSLGPMRARGLELLRRRLVPLREKFFVSSLD